MKRTIRPTFVALTLAIVLAACGAPAAQQPTAPPAPTAAPTPAPITVTDALGRQVRLDAAPQRIVSLAPSITESLFAIGAGQLVVGVTQFCNFPPAAEALPEVGGVTADTISVEAVVDLTPDLVIAGSGDQAPVVEALAQLGVPAILLDPQSFEEVYAHLALLGYLTGTTGQADAVVAEMRARVDAVTAKVASVPAERRPTVFYEVFDEPLMSAGPETFIGQMIELAGAKNIFGDAAEDYPTVSAEAIVERDPDAIIGPDYHADKLTPALIAQRPGWAELTAVKEGRVYLLNADITSRPGPRLAEALEALAAALYPELFT
jgi:iron complex transport system substrate-binding protein